MEILAEYGIDPGGSSVVVGRSNIVGKPTLLLPQKHGTVTVPFPNTGSGAGPARRIFWWRQGKGQPDTADMVKPGAVVIDVATNRNEVGKLCGDVAFAEVKEIAFASRWFPAA